MSEQNSAIILDATSAEFSGELQDDNLLWQRRGFEIALEHINTLVKEAKVVSKAYENAVNSTLPRIHDAIFISGGRGTGKTVFLYNLAKQWQDSDYAKSTKVKFLDIIDPTLLLASDNFVNVIIAHIHKAMREVIDKSHVASDYHNLLNDVAESLGQSEYDHRDSTGIDRIIGYQSSMDLERNFHDYVEYCCKQLNVDAIAMPIDDVDMALTKAHDLLETIRRLLSCPQLIPIVCGDEKIYHELLLDHFEFAGRNDFEHRKVLEREGPSKHLAKQYWRKVFPEQLRIGLLSLEFLTINMKIKGKHRQSNVLDFYEQLASFFTPLVNGEGGSHNFPLPDTPRKLVQVVKQFYRYFDLGVIEQHSEFEHYNLKVTHKNKQVWHNLMVHAQTSGFNHGVLLGHSEAMWRDEHYINDRKLKVADLPLFNIFKQAEICREKQLDSTDKFFAEIAKELVKVYKEPRHVRDMLPSFIDVQIKLFDELNISEFDLAVKMPMVETISLNLMVPNKDVDEVLVSKTQRSIEYEMELVQIYTHLSEYGKTKQNGYQVYYSRAYEILMQTTLYEYENEFEFAYYLESILSRAPFYSVTAIEKERHKSSGNFDSRIDIQISADEYSKRRQSFKQFVENVMLWRKTHNEILEQAKEIGLLHLFNCVMQKVFSELHNYRVTGVFRNDNLFNCVRRFELILLNALGWYLQVEGPLIDQAVAKTPESLNLMIGDSEANDPSYRNNVKQFLDNEQKTAKGRFNQKLFVALNEHPLFGLLSDYDHGEDQHRLLLRFSDDRRDENRMNELKTNNFETMVRQVISGKPKANKRMSGNKRSMINTKESLVVALDRNFSSVINHSSSVLKAVFANVESKDIIEVANQIKRVVEHVYKHTEPKNGSVKSNYNWMIDLLKKEYGAKE